MVCSINVKVCIYIFTIYCMIVIGNTDQLFLSKTHPISTETFIRHFGYPAEAHEVTTEDGYILKCFRIPHGKSHSSNTIKRKPVLLQHGLLASSGAWVFKVDSLAYVLADAGFDVWLGNARGNLYSRKHVKYDPDKDKERFWDFSWHEIGYYDLPAVIDYILQNSEQDKLFYIGHSMGTIVYYVLGATRPEYLNKVEAMVSMAPAIFLWHIRSSQSKMIMKLSAVIHLLVKQLNVYEVMTYTQATYWYSHHICGRRYLRSICKYIFFSLFGFNDKGLDKSMLPIIAQGASSGSSLKVFLHFNQVCKKGVSFRQFDYEKAENKKRYGSEQPPSYNLTKVTTPLYIYYSMNDLLVGEKDVLYGAKHFPNVRCITKVPDDKFSHGDFVWNINAKNKLYDHIITTICKLTSCK